jgi:hypothetical protein
VHARFGSPQLALLAPSLRAVSYRLAHAQYHYQECQRIVAAHVDDRLELGSDIWEIVFPSSPEDVLSHNHFFIQSEAHLCACVQAIHAVADNLAHVVYFALGVKLGNALATRDVSLDSMIAYLEKACQTESSLKALFDLLQQLKSADAFKDLCELTNQLKHHGGPSINLALEPSPEQTHEMRFGNFVRRGQWHSERAASDLLGEAFRVVNVAVVDVGIALNCHLQTLVNQRVPA